MKKELTESLTTNCEARAQPAPRICYQRPVHAGSDHFADVGKMVDLATSCPPKGTMIAFCNLNSAVEFALTTPYTSSDIRPMAVRPLDHPERWPTPWGFLFSDAEFAAGQLQ